MKNLAATLILTAGFGLLSVSNAAVTINVIAQGAGTYQTPTGGALDATYTMQWGVFDLTAFDALSPTEQGTYSSVAPLLSVSQEIQFDASGQILRFNVPSQSFDLPLAGGGTTGDQLYALVFSTLGTVGSEFGVFSSTNTVWAVPAENGSASLSNAFLDAGNGGQALVGSISGNNALLANSVPEPSTYALLAGVMTLGLVAYRRRRS